MGRGVGPESSGDTRTGVRKVSRGPPPVTGDTDLSLPGRSPPVPVPVSDKSPSTVVSGRVVSEASSDFQG